MLILVSNRESHGMITRISSGKEEVVHMNAQQKCYCVWIFGHRILHLLKSRWSQTFNICHCPQYYNSRYKQQMLESYWKTEVVVLLPCFGQWRETTGWYQLLRLIHYVSWYLTTRTRTWKLELTTVRYRDQGKKWCGIVSYVNDKIT